VRSMHRFPPRRSSDLSFRSCGVASASCDMGRAPPLLQHLADLMSGCYAPHLRYEMASSFGMQRRLHLDLDRISQARGVAIRLLRSEEHTSALQSRANL